jgi:hypothetical protein
MVFHLDFYKPHLHQECFDHYQTLATKIGHHLMVKNKFCHQQMTNYEFGHHQWIKPIFGRHLETIKWQLKYFLVN